MCQATGRAPDRKYEDQGGPTLADMIGVLRANSCRPEAEMVKSADFLLINYAALAPDGHAKIVSIRILPTGDVRMAPLYDLASALPYRSDTVDRSLALSIGGQRRISDIHARQWAKAAAQLGMPEEQLRERARHLTSGFPDALRDALEEVGTAEAREIWARAAEPAARHADLCPAGLEEPVEPLVPRTRGGGPARGRTTPASNQGSFKPTVRSESDVELS